MTLPPEWVLDVTHPEDLDLGEYVEFDSDVAVSVIANAMVRFDRYVSNIQGACDVETFNSMLSRAIERYEEMTAA
jgi:hypothetical protein